MKYVRQNIRSLRDLVYASSIMEFNLLERVNHMDYFLSIGKLHTGYIRDFEKYYGISKTLYNNLRQISNAILPRLHKPVYQKNKIRNRHLSLKKTNIFLMQKDYHQVYVLYKYLLSKKPIVEEEKEKTDLAALQQNYFYFVQTICIFAVGHFNFEIDPSQKMDMKSLDSTFTFKDWSVRLVNLLNKGLLLSIRKDKTYQIILTPSIQEKNEDSLNDYSIPYKPDEVHICTPFEEDYLERKEEFISIENIESFRRIQQLLLKGMIYSDTERKECPFCLSQLTYNKKEKFYECESCRTQIKEGSCKENGKKYYYTDISNLKKTEWNSSDFSKEDQWLYQRRVEANLFFRNITKIDNKGRPICPHCGKIHDK
jgi:ribosomal protein L37AE/L43A